MLVITATLILFGKLGDKIGSHKIYSNGFLIFAFGSLLCSFSPNLYLLVASRIVQAIGASMLMATGMGIVSTTFPPSELGKALGLTGAMVGVGSMTGPSLGGLLVSSFGWPIIFIINIPIGFIGYYFSKKHLPQTSNKDVEESFDYIGIVLFAVFAILLVTSLSKQEGISLLLLAISGLCFIAFWQYEKKVTEPMLDFDLFKIKAFLYGNVLGVFAYTSQTFIIFLLPFYLERLLLLTPAYSGLFMTILPVTMAITAPIAGTLSDKYGSDKLTSIGLFVLFSAHMVFSSLGSSANYAYLILALFLAGLGMGLFGSPNNSSILGSIPPHKSGYAGGFISTIRNFSFSLGIAISASLFSLILAHNESSLGFEIAYGKANQVIYLVAAGLTFTGFIISLLTRESRIKNKESEKEVVEES